MSVVPGLVVGTAGHIDHGKTSLVRTLTGVDLDSLPEEKARGITIALGFTPLDLPSGRRVALVDVPGHERLVRTMISGATGIDAVLLCVSAVDGAMPQTREHLAILDLLDVRQGAVVLTMADLVDDELLELAAEDIADTVKGTFLEGAPIIPSSAIDGRGRDEILALLERFADTRRAPTGPFRLPVDRAFSRPGFGTVATGTAWSGRLEDGSTVDLLPEGGQVRVRGVEVHGEKVAVAEAGRRTALNLAGIDPEQVPRGTVIAKGPVPCPHMIDVRYRHLAGAVPLEDGAAVRVLLGTAERLGRLNLAQEADTIEPGATVWAQLRLDGPLPCLPGDRFVVRRPSPVETLGGGEIVDPWATRLRHRDRARAAQELKRLHAGEQVVWLERAGEQGLTKAEWAARSDREVGELVGDRLLAPRVVARLQGALVEALAAFHDEHPLSLGANRRELRRGRLAHLSDRVFDALVDRLAANRSIRLDGPLVRVAGFKVELTPAQVALRDRIRALVREAVLEGRTTKQLCEALPDCDEVPALLRLLEADNAVVDVSGIGWTDPGALGDLEAKVRGWFGGHDELAPGDFKDLTGLTRKAAIPLLEWLDKQRITARRGDVRIAGPGLK